MPGKKKSSSDKSKSAKKDKPRKPAKGKGRGEESAEEILLSIDGRKNFRDDAAALLAAAGEAYLICKAVSPLIPEQEILEAHMETLARFTRTAQAAVWDETSFANHVHGMMDASLGFFKSVPAPGPESTELPWRMLRENMQFNIRVTEPLTVFPIGMPVMLACYEVTPNDIRQLIRALQDILRLFESPEHRRVLLYYIALLQAGLRDGITLQRLAQILANLMRWLQTVRINPQAYWALLTAWKERILPIIARVLLACEQAAAGTALAAEGSALAAALMVFLKILVALGIGIIIGWLINHIPIGGGRNVTDALGDLLYSWFWESEEDRLFAAENVIARELGQCRDKLNAGIPFSESERRACIANASAMIALATRKRQIGALSERLANGEIRRANALIERLLGG